MIDDQLRNAIDAITEPYTEYLSTWEEIQDYYQDEYPAHKWIGALVLHQIPTPIEIIGVLLIMGAVAVHQPAAH